ncbi:hypothetical protein BU15DRAFT_60615 [Melanogaster broomeanus]|nr:hypothetical protein BU15DRAFT_60615 [Melanogaster broomeanus]
MGVLDETLIKSSRTTPQTPPRTCNASRSGRASPSNNRALYNSVAPQPGRISYGRVDGRQGKNGEDTGKQRGTSLIEWFLPLDSSKIANQCMTLARSLRKKASHLSGLVDQAFSSERPNTNRIARSQSSNPARISVQGRASNIEREKCSWMVTRNAGTFHGLARWHHVLATGLGLRLVVDYWGKWEKPSEIAFKRTCRSSSTGVRDQVAVLRITLKPDPTRVSSNTKPSRWRVLEQNYSCPAFPGPRRRLSYPQDRQYQNPDSNW